MVPLPLTSAFIVFPFRSTSMLARPETPRDTFSVAIEFSETIFKAIEADPKTELEINLPEQTITLLATGQKESFDINGYKKNNMVNGFDDIDYLQSMKEEIVGFADKLPY